MEACLILCNGLATLDDYGLLTMSHRQDRKDIYFMSGYAKEGK